MNKPSLTVLTLTVIFLYLPLLVLTLFSFNASELMAFPLSGFTFRWYEALLNDQLFISGFITSFLVAQPVGLLSMVFGLMAAMALTAQQFCLRFAFAVLLVVPFLIPKSVLAISQAMVLSELGGGRGLVPLVVAQSLVSLPFTTAIILAVLARCDPRLLDAARDLGATPWQSFRLVLLPQLKGVLSGAYSIGVILSLADLTTATFLAGRNQPLSMVVASAFRREIRPDLNAVQVVVMLMTALFVLAGQLRIMMKERLAGR